MIKGLGIDVVEIERFIPWTTYSRISLSRIFSNLELDYSFKVSACTAQRLAIRFAAREALFKALSSIDPTHTVPFLSLCRHIEIEKKLSGAITLNVDWIALKGLGLKMTGPEPIAHISATHTSITAFVTVILERVNN